MKTTLVVMTLNEIEGMKAIMPQINSKWVDQILVIDGGSNDGTIEYSKSMGYDVYVQTKKGIRHGMIEGWDKIKGNYVITFSPDGNSKPELIPDLIRKTKEGYDMVIASRYAEGAKSEDDDKVTCFGNWLFNKTVNFLYNTKYTDCMVIYRMYRKDLFYELDLDKERSYFPEKLFFTVMGCEPLLSVRAVKTGMKIAEIPGDEPARIGGERKLQIIRWGGAYFVQFFWELFFWRKKV
jgi:glycosyltransferase involved in cell wall biosynthesis